MEPFIPKGLSQIVPFKPHTEPGRRLALWNRKWRLPEQAGGVDTGPPCRPSCPALASLCPGSMRGRPTLPATVGPGLSWRRVERAESFCRMWGHLSFSRTLAAVILFTSW